MKKPHIEMDHEESEEMAEHEISSGIETLHQARKLMKDKKKMKKIHEAISDKHSSIMEMIPKEDDEEITSIKGIRKKANSMAMKKYE